MRDDDFRWLRERVLNIEAVVTRGEEAGKASLARVEVLETELKPIKAHVTLIQNAGKISLGLLTVGGLVAGIARALA